MERRRFIRVPVQVWVEQWTDQEMYLQQSANFSRGGIFLERTIPHPEGTLLNLRFTLPEDDRPIECRGHIVYPKAGEDFGMGIQFYELDDETRQRIDEFMDQAEASLGEGEA